MKYLSNVSTSYAKSKNCIFQPYSYGIDLILPLLLFVSPLLMEWRKTDCSSYGKTPFITPWL